MGILKDPGPWGSLRNLMAFFVLVFAVYILLMVTGRPFDRDLIAGEVFFLSAVFALLVVRYAYRTIHDVMRLDELEQLANTDELTHLYNRRAILRIMEEEFWKARRFGFPLSVALVDLDHFKKVNDTHGHISGDVVLQAVAAALRETLRKIDLVGRYGGEEFLCILPSTPAEGAVITAERIRNGISVRRFGPDRTGATLSGISREAADGLDYLVMTVSVGVATMGERLRQPTGRVGAADQALYLAKETGRDRTCSYEDVQESGLRG
jgi:diguanylate cyclase (GGDEF)-like protein